MTPFAISSKIPAQRSTEPRDTVMADARWIGLYRVGGMAALLMLVIMAVQIVVYVVWPPPDTVTDWFALYQDNWLLGLLSLDLLYLVNNGLLVLIFLALYTALRPYNESAMAIALVLGIVGIATYFASNPTFEMLSLSNQYADATTEAQRLTFLAAGEAKLATFTGTAFNVYYVLSAVALLIIALVMLRTSIFGKSTAYLALVTGALMVVPSTAGTTGLVFAFASLLPLAVFLALIARRLLQLGGATLLKRLEV